MKSNTTSPASALVVMPYALVQIHSGPTPNMNSAFGERVHGFNGDIGSKARCGVLETPPGRSPKLDDCRRFLLIRLRQSVAETEKERSNQKGLCRNYPYTGSSLRLLADLMRTLMAKLSPAHGMTPDSQPNTCQKAYDVGLADTLLC